MTKTKALSLGITIAFGSIEFILSQWWIAWVITLAIAAYFLWLFVSKFRRDRRFAMLSRTMRSLPQEDTPLSTQGSDGLFVPPPLD